MRELEISADELVASLLAISATEPVSILDSCGVGHVGSHLLVAGFRPVETFQIKVEDPDAMLNLLDDKLSGEHAGVFTLSYEFGAKLQNISYRRCGTEPDVFLALFDTLIVHDYDTGRTRIAGNGSQSENIADLLKAAQAEAPTNASETSKSAITSNFEMTKYIAAVENIREYIRSGNTYQTNLTQQLRGPLPPATTPQQIFQRLRRDHPAPFAAFIQRRDSTVVSASPERFFRVAGDGTIEASPIKGTRPRGGTPADDLRLRNELIKAEKDRAENTMIVDLMRNDLGRVCEFGSVEVTKLCDVEEHPTLFHLVSTIRGKLRDRCKFSEILRAVFPCGSITGAPKLRTMQIIDEIEGVERGLSMGAIGYYLPEKFGISESRFDISVAIRTMVIRDGEAVFNVGGGVVIDSDPEEEYAESLLKAKALMDAIGVELR